MAENKKPSWIKEAECMLHNYKSWQNSIENLKLQIESLNAELYSASISKISATPSYGGGNQFDDSLINKLDKRNQFKQQLESVEPKVKAIENGLKALSDDEQQLLDMRYINRPLNKNPIYPIMDKMNYSKSEVYRKINHAVTRFAINMYGCITL